jgi:N4-gp56 family major capsid protein
MATGNMTTTTHAAFIPEIWSQKTILAATEAAVIYNLVRRDFDGEINQQGDTVHVPLFSAVTTGDKTATNDVTFTNYTETTKDISIDTHKYFAYKVEDIAKVQSSPDLLSGYATQGGRAIAKARDVSLATLFTNAAITQNVGTANTSVAPASYSDITDAQIRRAIQYLDEAEAPAEDRYLVISPAQKNAMLGIAKFVEADKLGDNVTLKTGVFGSIYGVSVYISNNLQNVAQITSVASVASSGGASEITGVTGVGAYTACCMFHKEAFALATQIAPRVQTQYVVKSLANEVVGDILYGDGILVPTFAVQMRVTSEA